MTGDGDGDGGDDAAADDGGLLAFAGLGQALGLFGRLLYLNIRIRVLLLIFQRLYI